MAESFEAKSVNWYPGHMAKTKRQMEESIRLVDAVVEVVDARIPASSKNPHLNQLWQKRPRVLVLNKADRAPFFEGMYREAWEEASKVEVEGGGGQRCFATVVRDIGTGIETDRVQLPALFTVTEKFGELRPYEMRRVMKFKAAEPEILTCDDIGAEADRCGFAGSPTCVNAIQSVVLAGGAFKEIAPTDEGINGLVKELIDEHTIG